MTTEAKIRGDVVLIKTGSDGFEKYLNRVTSALLTTIYVSQISSLGLCGVHEE